MLCENNEAGIPTAEDHHADAYQQVMNYGIETGRQNVNTNCDEQEYLAQTLDNMPDKI